MVDDVVSSLYDDNEDMFFEWESKGTQEKNRLLNELKQFCIKWLDGIVACK